MTLINKHDLYPLKNERFGQGFQKLEQYKQTPGNVLQQPHSRGGKDAKSVCPYTLNLVSQSVGLQRKTL